MKKRYKKNKQTGGKIFFLLIVAMTSFVIYWAYFEVGKAKYAEEWSETRAENVSKIKFPKDEGYHSNKMEWWYYNGHLTTESGNNYSFHFTTFLVNNVMTHVVFHSSLSDHQQKVHYTEQSRIGGNPSVGVAEGFNFKHNNWLMQGANGHDRLKVDNDKFALDLKLESTQPPVFHGINGIISLNSDETSYYYSRTRMNITGFLKVHDTKEAVKGISWFDHQWGDFSAVNLSWDWFSLQLDNGLDLMFYQLRDNNENQLHYQGSYINNGKTEILNNNDFIITPLTEWTSSTTSNIYPVSWNIKVPQKKIDINVNSIVENSEFDAKLTTYNIYWEGAVNVSGTHNGKGFIELSGVRPKRKKNTYTQN